MTPVWPAYRFWPGLAAVVVVDGNPLEDISVLDPRMIMQGGAAHKNALTR
mgnify:CR=1 FL=1